MIDLPYKVFNSLMLNTNHLYFKYTCICPYWQKGSNPIFQYFSLRFSQYLCNLELFHSVDFGKLFFPEIYRNFLQHSANLNFVAIHGGFSPFWSQIAWTIKSKVYCAQPLGYALVTNRQSSICACAQTVWDAVTF